MTGPARDRNRPTGPALPDAIGRVGDEPPPFWGRWGRIYLVVAGLLLLEAGLFYGLTRWAS